MSWNVDCEGTELQTDDVVDDILTGTLYEVTSKQDSLPMVRVRRLDDRFYIRYFRPEAIRLIERRPKGYVR